LSFCHAGLLLQLAGTAENGRGQVLQLYDEFIYMHNKTILLSVAWDNLDTVFEVIEAYYRRLCDYVQFEDWRMVLGKSCGTHPSALCPSGADC